MIALVLFSALFAQPQCANVATRSPESVKLEAAVDKKMAQASNLATIAKEADTVLSKLISVKSPVLLNWLKKRNLMTAKEETIAKEWRLFYLNDYILQKFPTSQTSINNSVESVFSDIAKMAFDDAFKKRLAGLLEKAKKDSLALVESWEIDAKAKQQINDRVNAIKLYWFEKLKGTRFETKPLEFLSWGLAYDPQHNTINVGLHARRYVSDSNVYAVFAHEIGHAIDPCRWGAFFKGESPFIKVNRCLRSAESVGAKKRDDSKMTELMNNGTLSQEMAQSLKNNPTCNRPFYPPSGLQKDQLPEAFADWFSAEVFAASSFKTLWPRPDLCDEKELSAGSSYPSNEVRLTKIYGAQPVLKSQHRTSGSHQHCKL